MASLRRAFLSINKQMLMVALKSIAKFRPEAGRKLLNGSHTSRWSILARRYSKQSNRQTKLDPRRNARYSYVQGDPLHEDLIMKGSTTTLKDNFISRKEESIKKKKDFFETSSGLKFERLKEGDTRLGQTILAAKSNNTKTAADIILLEGQRLIRDALLLGAQAKNIYFCDPAVLDTLPTQLLKDINLYKILYRDMKTWSDATTPSGILGVFKKPQQGETVSVAEIILPITLIFDNVKDPGNAGTLIRTAAAVGCERIIVTKGSVNVWDCKVLRSAMGGHFNVPIYSGVSWADIPNYLDDNAQVFLANTWQSYMLTKTFDEKLQSDNLDKALVDSEISEPNSDNESDSDSQFLDQDKVNLKYLNAEKSACAFQNVPFSICDYTEIILNQPPRNGTNVDSTSKNNVSVSVALVVGGETEGLSAQAKKFAYSHYGHYVCIPMNNAVNSLNTAIAGSIILYELRKKLSALESNRYPGKK